MYNPMTLILSHTVSNKYVYYVWIFLKKVLGVH